MHPDYIHFLVFPGPFPPRWPISRKRRRIEKKYQVQFVLPIFSLEHGQTPSGQALNKEWVFPYPHPCQKPSTMKSYTQDYYPNF